MALFWLFAVAASFAVNYHGAVQERQRLALFSARSYFKQVLVTREWNARHGGVYVPVTGTARPNPYINESERDLHIDATLTLTKINPSFMTRMISEIAEESTGFRFHMTSLRPIRPENEASPLEAQYLRRFESGLAEGGEMIELDNRPHYFYIAPLRTEKNCLQCHARQGYREGDIRGGISISFPFDSKVAVKVMLPSHVGIALIGLGGIVLVVRKLKTSYSIIERQAVIDSLTGIPNRRSFSENILREFDRSRRNREPLSVIMGDIDCFKAYNDTYGHSAGDECLQRVAHEIKTCLNRPGDFCARFGGEEFIVILAATRNRGAMNVAERIRNAIEVMGLEHRGNAGAKVVTMSLGVSTMIDNNVGSYEELVRQADEALYRAKQAGRNRVCCWGEGVAPDE